MAEDAHDRASTGRATPLAVSHARRREPWATALEHADLARRAVAAKPRSRPAPPLGEVSRCRRRALGEIAAPSALAVRAASGRLARARGNGRLAPRGSLREVKGSLELAVVKGWLDGGEPAHALAHRLGEMLYRLAKL